MFTYYSNIYLQRSIPKKKRSDKIRNTIIVCSYDLFKDDKVSKTQLSNPDDSIDSSFQYLVESEKHLNVLHCVNEHFNTCLCLYKVSTGANNCKHTIAVKFFIGKLEMSKEGTIKLIIKDEVIFYKEILNV